MEPIFLSAEKKPGLSFGITPRAIKRLDVLGKSTGPVNGFFRIAVDGGGCSGFQYSFTFDETLTPDDVKLAYPGATVVIDEASLSLIKGGVLDYEEDLIHAAFVVKNPNATSGCGCGNSFSVI